MTESWITVVVLVVLVLLSVVTWTIGIIKVKSLKRATLLDQEFLKELSFEKLFLVNGGATGQSENSDLYILRNEIAVEARKLVNVPAKKDALISVMERKLVQKMAALMKIHERGHSELATIGSSAPFIGLFGTVWGIMDALKHISTSGQVSIEVVAGPVGEALITTAIGIAAALPAVYFYNYIARQLQLRHADLEKFSTDMINHLLEEV